MKYNKQQLSIILESAKPPVKDDIVRLYATLEGWKNEKLFRNEFHKAYYN